MKNEKIGKILIAVGVTVAIVPLAVISSFVYESGGIVLGIMSKAGPAFFVTGIVIIVIGEHIKKRAIA